MFCPECGTLSFPSPSGDITCTNYKCGYTGPANVKMKVEGKEIDLSKTKTTTKAEKREYEIIKDSFISIKIKDIGGRHIVTLINGYHSKGKHLIPWDGNNSRGDQQTSGIYFYTIENENYSRTGKMIFLK